MKEMIFIKKDLLIGALIAGFLVLIGSPFINSRGINIILFVIVIVTLWKSKKTSQGLLSTNRVLQMVNLVGIAIALITYIFNAFKIPLFLNLKTPLILLLGLFLQGFIYYYLSVWSKLLKEGKEVSLSDYKRPLIIIFLTIGVFSLFGEGLMNWFFAL